MARAFLWGGLAALLLIAGPALGAVGSSRPGTPSPFQIQQRSDDDDCARNGSRRRTRFERTGCNEKQEPRPGYSRRNALQRPTAYGERSHSSACRCSPCNSSRRSRNHRDRTVVVIDTDGGDAVVVLTNGRRRDDRGYHVSPSRDHAAIFGVDWNVRAQGPTVNVRGGNLRGGNHDSRLRRHADADCREPGTVLASSGNLYVQVRADGRLTIRSR